MEWDRLTCFWECGPGMVRNLSVESLQLARVPAMQLCQDAGSMAKDVIISQGIVPKEAGEMPEMMMSSNNPEAAICIEAIQQLGEQLVQSINLSMIK